MMKPPTPIHITQPAPHARVARNSASTSYAQGDDGALRVPVSICHSSAISLHRFMILRVLALATAAGTARFVVAAEMYSISASYLGDQCGGTPYAVNIAQDDNCVTQTCSPSSSISSADMRTVDCSSAKYKPHGTSLATPRTLSRWFMETRTAPT